VQAGWFDAVVTAPLQKSTINDAGDRVLRPHRILRRKTGTPQVVMMLAGQPHAPQDAPPLRVALATTHLPLREVPPPSRRTAWRSVLDIIHADLRASSASPRRASWWRA
jgi:4-hydroxythreonine-4-phosphate dehydrogenase